MAMIVDNTCQALECDTLPVVRHKMRVCFDFIHFFLQFNVSVCEFDSHVNN